MQWLNEQSRLFLERGYLVKGTSPEVRVRQISEKAEEILGKPGFADKFEKYMAAGYYSLSSPVWSNFGLRKGLPISCFGSYVPDDMGSILYAVAEAGMMSKYGGGTSGYFGDLRPRGAHIQDNGQSSGSVHFMKLFETLVNIVSQGSVRRGHFAPYLPTSHPDIMEFLDIGTEGNPIQMLNTGVTVTNDWLQSMVDGDEEKREIWAKVLERRTQLGFPYIMFVDTANEGKPDIYKELGLKIHASNLCSEIMLPSKNNWSFVCNLSSMNLLHYDKWKDTDAVETMVYFLDAVMTDFLTRLEAMRDSGDPEQRTAFKFMKRAYNFALENRAIGLGVLGWHSYLQDKMIPLESTEANLANVEIFSYLQKETLAASQKMAQEYGEPAILKGHGRRHTTLMAVAPTTSSAFILGQVSQSIEPVWSNCYVKDIDKMKVTIKNPFLVKLLEEKGMNTTDVWHSIRDNDGSVQHLEGLTPHEKAVFRTFPEIDQSVLIEQAGVRQLYIDQGQSLNVMVSPSTPIKEVNALYLQAWKQGIKSLYYQHSMSAAQQLSRRKICLACQA